jgi:ParB family chromosome partitioning protein
MAKLELLKEVKERTGTKSEIDFKSILIFQIESKQNVRETENIGIEDLKSSIRQVGLLQPIGIYQIDTDKYICLWGHRRLRAYKELYQENPDRFDKIPAIITDNKNITTKQIIENLQRVDLTAHELYQALKELKKQGLKYKQIAGIIGKSEGYIKNLYSGIKEIDTSPENIEILIKSHNVTLSDFQTIKTIKDTAAKKKLIKQKAENKLTQLQLQQKVQKIRDQETGQAEAENKTTPKALKINIQDQEIKQAEANKPEINIKYDRLTNNINNLISDYKSKGLIKANKQLNKFIIELKEIIKVTDIIKK